MRSIVALALLVVGVSSQYTWCPSGGVPYDALSRCFYFVQKPTIFTDAEQLCTNFGGHLISIINAFENSFITSNATFAFPNTPFWIGGRQTAQQGQFAWTDGTTWSYSNWDGGEPNLANNCVARNLPDNAWRTSDCNQLRPYVCSVPGQYSNGSSSSCTLGTCPGGWTLFSATSLPQDAYCYKAINVTRWDDAEWNCGSENAHLASIHGPIENAFVAYLAKDNRIITDSSYDQTHVGLTSPKPFNFRTWSDGTPYDYENWADNEPSLNSGDNGCLAIASDPITKYAQWGQWVITNCDKTARNAVCKKRPTF